MNSVDQAREWLAARGIRADQPALEPDPEPTGGRGESAGSRRSTGGRRRASGPSEAWSDVTPGSVTDAEPGGDEGVGTAPKFGSSAAAEAEARKIVLRKLSARACSRDELARALTAREIPAPAATRVLDRMQEIGLINDAAFAADWVESRQARRQLSATALRQELKAKGIDAAAVEAALDVVDTDREYAAALDLARRRARATDGLEREVRYRRLAGILGRRGFSSGLIVRVLSEVLDR